MKNLEFNRIHKFVFDDCYIILDVNSGSIHLGDALFFDYLDFLEEEPQSAMPRLIERYGKEACEGLEEALRELIDEGLLFSKADFSDCAFIWHMIATFAVAIVLQTQEAMVVVAP